MQWIPEEKGVIDKSAAKRIATLLGWQPKREWVSLTDDQARKVIEETLGLPEGYIPLDNALNICRAIEAKLREKNG